MPSDPFCDHLGQTLFKLLVADLFLFCYERDFMKSLSRENQADQSELPRPIKIRPRMYVRCSIMYEKAAFCSPEENSSEAR